MIAPPLAHEVLRISTAGSVDDGKSTLIGRLLYDSKAIPDDQYEAIQRVSDGAEINLALLTDGLRAEREQQITIDVAYRYFSTDKRRFIIADTPGHAQYTRNMVTGASTADLAIILVDARNGILNQSKRHAVIAGLLRVPRVVVAVNKMDLVDFDEGVFRRIEEEFRAFASPLGVAHLDFIPISALRGDNVVDRSGSMPWYDGPSVLEFLESVPVEGLSSDGAFRLPVQCVIRPNQDFRGFAGRVASGSLRVGEEIEVARTGLRSRVTSVLSADGSSSVGLAGDSVVVTLADEIDVSRGDLLFRPAERVEVTTAFEATVCWMGEQPLQVGKSYVLAHGTSEAPAVVRRVVYRLDVETLDREVSAGLALNEIGRVEISASRPLFFDLYGQNRSTGSLILIDPATNVPVAAGMVTRTHLSSSSVSASSGAVVLLSGFEPEVLEQVEDLVSASGHRTVLLSPASFEAQGLDFGLALRVGRLFASSGTVVLVADPFGVLGDSEGGLRVSAGEVGDALGVFRLVQGALSA